MILLQRKLKSAVGVSLILAMLTALFVAAPAQAAVDPSQVVSIARSLVGASYVYGGESPSGFDSSGYVQYVYKQVGITLPRTVRYQSGAGVVVSRANLQPGDLVFFTISSRTPNMVGIYVGDSQFLTASRSAGKVTYRSFTTYYNNHFWGARRVTGLPVESPAPAPTPTPTPSPDPQPSPEPAPAPNSAQADRLIAYAKTLLGTPYKFGANGPNYFDCSSFTQTVFRKFGLSIPRTSLSQSKVGTYVSQANLQKGDLIFFQNTYKAGVSHVGIYIGDGKFIHAWPRGGVKISRLSERYFVEKWWGAKRVIK